MEVERGHEMYRSAGNVSRFYLLYTFSKKKKYMKNKKVFRPTDPLSVFGMLVETRLF